MVHDVSLTEHIILGLTTDRKGHQRRVVASLASQQPVASSQQQLQTRPCYQQLSCEKVLAVRFNSVVLATCHVTLVENVTLRKESAKKKLLEIEIEIKSFSSFTLTVVLSVYTQRNEHAFDTICLLLLLLLVLRILKLTVFAFETILLNKIQTSALRAAFWKECRREETPNRL